MRLSAKTEYACIAMLDLSARYGSNEPIRIRKIAERHGVPSRFLVQILLQLKGAGLVASTRGAAGGYQLVKPPDQVSLGEVIDVVEGGQDNAVVSNASPDSMAAKVILQAWQEAVGTQREALSKISLADLLERAKGRADGMYYI